MTEVKEWSQTASTNAQPSPDGWPEGMARSGVNDSAREMMGALRRYFDDPQWLDLTVEDGEDYTVSKHNDTTVKLTPTSGTDSTISRYPDGSRIRLGDGSPTLYGFVASTSYSTPDSYIEVTFELAASTVPAGVDVIEIACVKDIITALAYSPIGSTLAQEPPHIPSIDLLGDGATLDQGTGNGFDADTVDGKHYTDILEDAAAGSGRVGFNTEFMVWQRGVTIDSDTSNQKVHVNDNGLYCADRWMLLSGLATPIDDVVDATRETSDVPEGFWSAIKLTGATVSGGSGNAERAGVFQVLEKRDCAKLIDNTEASLSFYAQTNAASNITGVRAMVLGWTGSEDTLGASSDPISSWGAEGVAPTLKANWSTLLDTGRITNVDNTWRRTLEENVDFSLVANVNNIGILLFIDDSEWTTGDYAAFTGVQLQEGTTASAYVHTPYAEERSRCLRYFQKTQDEDVQPEANQGVAGAIHTTANQDIRAVFRWDFAAGMRDTPTINRYNPSADATTPRNITNGANVTVTGSEVETIGTRSVSITDTYAVADRNDILAIHLDAEAEF